MLCCSLLIFFSLASAEVYFRETFDEGFDDHWVYSDDTSTTHGVFSHHQQQHCPEGDLAIKASNASSYYHVSSPFVKPLNTEKSSLHFQYVFQYPPSMGCGGGYVKLFSDLDPKTLTGQSPYAIMVGPDVCGSATQMVHLIISHKGVNYPLKEKVSFFPDTNPHLIELRIGTDKTFYLKVDDEVKAEGLLDDHFEYLAPKMIDDPEDVKPENWVDDPMMVDPESKKPDEWDDRRDIPDPNAKKPEDWDDAADGEWEADFIKNPEFKSEWTPKMIPNPGYKGKWERKQIPNPEYVKDTSFANFDLKWSGMDLWTVEAGTVFDDFIVTDDAEEAKVHRERVMAKLQEFIAKKKEEEPKQEDIPEPQPGPGEPESEPESDHDDEEHEDL